MHTVFEFAMGAYLQVLASADQLAKLLSGLAGAHGYYTLAALVISSLLLGLLCCVWAIGERVRAIAQRDASRRALGRAQAELRFREAVISAGSEALTVLNGESAPSLSYRGGAALLAACLDGPDGAILAAKLEALNGNGTAFSLRVRTASFPAVGVRGRPVGARPVLFLRPEKDAAQADADLSAALDAMPIPIWIRNRRLALTWANRAFLAATGSPTLAHAVSTDAALDRSDRELARAASDGTQVAGERRYLVADGRRRAVSIDVRRLPDSSVAGFATDITDLARAEAKLQLDADAFTNVLNTFETAVAIFGADRRLATYNAAYARMWNLPEQWLDTHPSLNDIFDRLRETRRLPEQRDFAAWKREHMGQFENADHQLTETWHSPTGLSVDVRSFPYLLGGAIYLFRDISERLRMEASYQMLLRSQRAALNTVAEAMAIFGPDGRLKLHNDAFARAWRLNERELAGEPHVTKVAGICAARTGPDGIWSMVSAGVNSTEPARYGEWSPISRGDGRTLSVALTPLPEGATLVTFSDITDLQRFQSAMRRKTRTTAA